MEQGEEQLSPLDEETLRNLKYKWVQEPSKYFDRNVFDTMEKIEGFAHTACSSDFSLNRFEMPDDELLVPPPPPSLLDYISRAASAKLPPEGRLNRQERELFSKLLPTEIMNIEKSKELAQDISEVLRNNVEVSNSDELHDISAETVIYNEYDQGVMDARHKQNVQKRENINKLTNEEALIESKKRIISNQASEMLVDMSQSETVNKKSKVDRHNERDHTKSIPRGDEINYSRKRKQKRGPYEPDVRKVKDELLPRVLYQRFNMSALVATGISIEETLTSLLMPLAQFYVDHCRSSGNSLSFDQVVTPGEALVEALSSSNHPNVNLPWLPSSLPSTFSLLSGLKKGRNISSFIKNDILSIDITDSSNRRYENAMCRWAACHGYNKKEFRHIKSFACTGPLLCTFKCGEDNVKAETDEKTELGDLGGDKPTGIEREDLSCVKNEDMERAKGVN